MAQLGLLVSEDPEEEKRQKEFKSFLNKITPDNYETIREKIIAVGIDSPATLQGLIDQVRRLSFYPLRYLATVLLGLTCGEVQTVHAIVSQALTVPNFSMY